MAEKSNESRDGKAPEMVCLLIHKEKQTVFEARDLSDFDFSAC